MTHKKSLKISTETFCFDKKYEFDYEYDFLAFELVMLTTRSSACNYRRKKEDGHKIGLDNNFENFCHEFGRIPNTRSRKID